MTLEGWTTPAGIGREAVGVVRAQIGNGAVPNRVLHESSWLRLLQKTSVIDGICKIAVTREGRGR